MLKNTMALAYLMGGKLGPSGYIQSAACFCK